MSRYTHAQKQQILSEVKESGNISLIGRKNNIPTSTIHTWLKKDADHQVTSKDSDVRIKELKKELSDKDLELKILRDLLKKTYQV